MSNGSRACVWLLIYISKSTFNATTVFLRLVDFCQKHIYEFTSFHVGNFTSARCVCMCV